jgi:parallel beta-helix repeat protein
MKSGVALYGGFNGTESSLSKRNWTTNVTTIDGSTARGGSPAYHVVTMDSITSSTIDGFTITGGNANGGGTNNNDGGGILCLSLNDTNLIANNTVMGNSAVGYGGGICCNFSSPTITNNTVSGNSGNYCAGGIFCHNYSSPEMTNNTISGNSTSGSGGAIYCLDYSSPVITKNTITGNVANGHAGGILCVFSTPEITNNTISGNSSSATGGGITCTSSSPLISNNTITANSAVGGGDRHGGGIACYDSSPVISNNTITANSASDQGGGIFCFNNSCPTITNNIISGNSAVLYGGGIACSSSSPGITNNIVSGNSSAQCGAGVYCQTNSSPSIINNTISGNSAYYYGGGIACRDNSSPQTKNNIFFSNNKYDIYEYDATSDPAVSYNDFYGNAYGVYYDEGTAPYTSVSAMDLAIAECSNNIGLAPLFVGDTLSGGTWTAGAVYNFSTFQTTLTNSSASWTPNEHTGRLLNPDTTQNKQFVIVSNTATAMVVWGDATTIAQIGDTYKIFDYHLQNLYDGYSNESPCIDAGDPADDYSNEPEPNGHRINQGNYGNTSEAARTTLPALPGPPSTPLGLQAIGGADSILLTWFPNTESDLVGYNVYRDDYSTGTFTNKLNTVPVAENRYLDTSVTIGETYYYKISAVDVEDLESAKTAAVSGTTGDITVTMPDYRGAPNTDVFLKINCAYATGITGNGMDIRVTYDKNILTPIEVKKTVLTQDFTFVDNISIADGQINISGVSAAGATINGQGHLLNIKFHVSASADMLTTATHTFVLVKMYNAALQPLNIDYSDTALFTVASDHIQGDVNGDGVVDSADALMALQAALGQRTLSDEEFNAADLNGDGVIDSADVTLILRLAVGLPLNPTAVHAVYASGSHDKAMILESYASEYLMSIADYMGATGCTIDIPIQLNEVNGIAALEAYVNYDWRIAHLQDVTKTTLTSGFTLNYDNSPGIAKIALSSAQALSSGSGPVAVMKFKVVGLPEEVTSLCISKQKLSGQYGDDLSWSASVATSNGSLRVASTTSARLWHLYE